MLAPPILSSLELICFSEGAALDSLSKKPLQTEHCEYSRFSPAIPVNYLFSHSKLQMCQRHLGHEIFEQVTFLHEIYFATIPDVLRKRQYQSFYEG